MRRSAAGPEAQSFDRVAENLDRLGELSDNKLVSSWLAGVLPQAGRHAIDLGCGPGRQAVLLAGHYDLVLCVRTLHHVPDLYTALSHLKALVAPGGRLVVVDSYDIGPDPRWPRRLVQRLVPLRPRLHAMAGLGLAANAARRGPGTAWEIYRLTTRREWVDHRVSDRFFTRQELVRCCGTLLPRYRLDVLGGPRGIGLVWDLSY